MIKTIIAMNVAINTTMIVKLTAKRILSIQGSFSFTPLIFKHLPFTNLILVHTIITTFLNNVGLSLPLSLGKRSALDQHSFHLLINNYLEHAHILYKTSIYLYRQDIVFYYACTIFVHVFLLKYNKDFVLNTRIPKKQTYNIMRIFFLYKSWS